MKMKLGMKFAELSALSLIMASSALAGGNGAGNGGNAVVCFPTASGIAELLKKASAPGSIVVDTIPDQYISAITSVEALELYEAKEGVHDEAAKTPMELNAGETVDEFIERIKHRFDPWTLSPREILTEGQAMFGGRVLRVNDATIIPKSDIKPLVKPKAGCVYTTVMAQNSIGTSDLKRLVIDKRIYEHAMHSELSKAVLKMHEYTLAYNTFHAPTLNEDSEGTRAMTARMIAKNINLKEITTVFDIYGVGVKLGGFDKDSIVLREVKNLEMFEIGSTRGANAVHYEAKNKYMLEHNADFPQVMLKHGFNGTLRDRVENCYFPIYEDPKTRIFVRKWKSLNDEDCNTAKAVFAASEQAGLKAYSDYLNSITPEYQKIKSMLYSDLAIARLSDSDRKELTAEINSRSLSEVIPFGSENTKPIHSTNSYPMSDIVFSY